MPASAMSSNRFILYLLIAMVAIGSVNNDASVEPLVKEVRRLERGAQLNHRHLFGIEGKFFQACLHREIGCRAELADGNSFSLEILNGFDLGTGYQFESEQIKAAGNHRDIRALHVGGDRQRSGGKEELALVRKQSLHSESAAIHRQIFHFQPVFLK